MTDDKYFAYFLSKFPLTRRGAECTEEHVERFRGVLPESLLRYWQEFGFSGFGDGLVWLTDPIEWQSTAAHLTQGIEHPDLHDDAEYIPFARTAFGKIYFWTPGFGHSLVIEPMYGNAEYVRPPRADRSDDSLRSFFSAATSESLQRIVTPSGEDCQLFRSVYYRIGHLPADRMYAFVPSLGVGGPRRPEATVAHAIHVHLELLRDFAGEWDTSGLHRGSSLSRDFFDWLRTQPDESRIDLYAWIKTLPNDSPLVVRHGERFRQLSSAGDNGNIVAHSDPSNEAPQLDEVRRAYDRIATALERPITSASELYNAGWEIATRLTTDPSAIAKLPADAPLLVSCALELAGEDGIAEAYVILGVLYRLEVIRQDSENKTEDKALTYFRKASELGANKASFFFADAAYANRNQKAAEEAWTRLRGYITENVDDVAAQLLAGYMLQSGFGTGADPTRAGEHLTRAADLGDPAAAFELALRSLEGLGTTRDPKTGISWLFRAAELGSDRAKYNLGAFYATGMHGLPTDSERAFMWYSDAASNGHAEAAFNAAVMILRNEGEIDDAPEYATQLLAVAAQEWGVPAVKLKLTMIDLDSKPGTD